MFERRPSDSRIDLSGLRIRSGFSSAIATYAAVLRDTYGASEVWPLVNIASGTTITAFIDSARNGMESGWALQNAAGPVTGTLAPLSAVNDVGNIHTASLAGIFSALEGSMFAWGSVTNWADGAFGFLASLGVDDNNRIQIYKNNTSNQLGFQYIAGATTESVIVAASASGFFSAAITWSKSADQMKAYYLGAQVGTTQTTLGTWVGSLAAIRTNIGSSNNVGANSFKGLMAYVAVKFGSVWSAAEIAAMHTAAATAGPDV